MAWVKGVVEKEYFRIHPYCAHCGSPKIVRFEQPSDVTPEQLEYNVDYTGVWYPGCEDLDKDITLTYFWMVISILSACGLLVVRITDLIRIETGICTPIGITLLVVIVLSTLRIFKIKAIKLQNSKEFYQNDRADNYCKCTRCGEIFKLPSSPDDPENNPKNRSLESMGKETRKIDIKY